MNNGQPINLCATARNKMSVLYKMYSILYNIYIGT